MGRVDTIVLICKIQLEQLADRERRLRREIEDGKIQMEYLKLLMDEIKYVNVIEYLTLDKSVFDGDSEHK